MKILTYIFTSFNSFFVFQSLYESIKTEPFKIPEDDGNDLMHTFFNPDKEGWLWKQGGRYTHHFDQTLLKFFLNKYIYN